MSVLLKHWISGGGYWTQLLPQKLIVTPDVYTDEMDAIGSWTHTGASLNVNTTEKYSGTGSLKLTSNAAGVSVDLRKNVSLDLSADNGNSLRLWAFPHSSLTGINYVEIFAFCGAGYDNLYGMAVYFDSDAADRWNLISPEADWYVAGGVPNWNDVRQIWVRVHKDEGVTSVISFDLMTEGIIVKPSILIMFDDGNESDYTKAYPLLKAKGMVATSYLVSSNRGAGSISDAQLIDLNNNKWDIGNHTVNHPLIEGAMTVQDFIDEMEGCRAYLDNIGLTRASKHVGATGAAYSADWVTAAIQWGAKTLRPGSAHPNVFGAEFPYHINVIGEASPTLVGTKVFIDNAIERKWTVMIYIHKIVDSGAVGIEWLTSDISLLFDYIESLGLQTLTIDEYYRLYSGPITVHHK